MDSTFRFLIKPRANVAGFLLTTAAIVLFFSQLQSGYAQDEQGASVPAAGEQTPNGPVDGNGIEPVPSPAAKASAGANRPQTVSVKAFGAVGDGVTNDTTAFNKALAACAVNGGTCLVPEGTYVISASGISPERNKACVVSGVHLKGAGQASILKVAGMPTNHLLQCSGDNWSVENLTFDMQDYTASKIGYAAITCRGNNWKVAHCAIVRSGRWAIQAYGGSNWTIEANYINRTV
ncbi:MAG TPA: glycosyl hydrolase family 28-related protein, partial [Flavisolibacter sp.]|nr:glycosyl hydrolase family 28-related protein [Flavisolibacter sp.]